jgi:hypothetical protein
VADEGDAEDAEVRAACHSSSRPVGLGDLVAGAAAGEVEVVGLVVAEVDSADLGAVAVLAAAVVDRAGDALQGQQSKQGRSRLRYERTRA